MKQTKRIMALLLMTILVAGAVMMNGCSLQKKPSRVDTAKAALQAKYGEEFNVRIDESYSEVFYVTCSPVNNPEVLFEAKMCDTDTDVAYIGYDDYYERYTASLINEIFEKDLQKFFPGAYFRTEIKYVQKEEFTNINERSLVELIENVDEKKRQLMSLDIYVDASIGTTKQYEKEYQYFWEIVESYVKENKMLPVTVCIVKLDAGRMDQVKQYFKQNAIIYNYEEVLGGRLEGVYGTKDTSAGNPPSMSACFDETYVEIESLEEYTRRREIWEDAK